MSLGRKIYSFPPNLGSIQIFGQQGQVRQIGLLLILPYNLLGMSGTASGLHEVCGMEEAANRVLRDCLRYKDK